MVAVRDRVSDLPALVSGCEWRRDWRSSGILSRLDHLVKLGVDAIWISPIYPSPMADFGYDVADYCAIHPSFGSLDDFERLVAAAHERNLKLILDYAPNHTSD